MKRLTFDVVLAGTLAVAPLAFAQEPRNDNLNQVPTDTTRDREGVGSPSTTRPGTEVPPAAPPVTPPMTKPSPVTTPDLNSAPRVPSAESGDLAIVRRVHESNQSEIAMAQLALEKSESSKVKS